MQESGKVDSTKTILMSLDRWTMLSRMGSLGYEQLSLSSKNNILSIVKIELKKKAIPFNKKLHCTKVVQTLFISKFHNLSNSKNMLFIYMVAAITN